MGIILLLYLGQYFCSSAFTVAHSVWLFLGHQAAVQIGQDFVSHEHDAGTVCGNCSWLWCSVMGGTGMSQYLDPFGCKAFVVLENGFWSQAERGVMQKRLEMPFLFLLQNPTLVSLWQAILVSTFAPSQGLGPLITETLQQTFSPQLPVTAASPGFPNNPLIQKCVCAVLQLTFLLSALH